MQVRVRIRVFALIRDMPAQDPAYRPTYCGRARAGLLGPGAGGSGSGGGGSTGMGLLRPVTSASLRVTSLIQVLPIRRPEPLALERQLPGR